MIKFITSCLTVLYSRFWPWASWHNKLRWDIRTTECPGETYGGSGKAFLGLYKGWRSVAYCYLQDEDSYDTLRKFYAQPTEEIVKQMHEAKLECLRSYKAARRLERFKEAEDRELKRKVAIGKKWATQMIAKVDNSTVDDSMIEEKT